MASAHKNIKMIMRSLKKTEALFDEVRWNQDINHIQKLISQGANVNAEDFYMNTPLHIASAILPFYSVCDLRREVAQSGSSGKHAGKSKVCKIIETRIRRGADVVDLLLRHGANVNAKCDEQYTPLHWATGVEQAIDFLSSLSNDWPGFERKEQVELLEVTRQTVTRIAELLLSNGADVNGEDPNGSSSESYVLNTILRDDDRPLTPLHLAVKYSSSAHLVELLLKYGADANARNYDGETLLFEALRGDVPRIVELLLEYGAHVNARDIDDRTPLHALFEIYYLRSFKTMLDLLLEYGADLEARDEDGRTPAFYINDGMHHFMEKPKQFFEVINEVFSHGVCVNATDRRGSTLYNYLTRGAEINLGEKKFVFLNHMRKLVALSVIHMAKNNRPLFFDIVDPFKEDCTILQPMQQTNPPEGEGDDIYDSCLDEVDVLKTIQIFPNVTLADVLNLGDPVTVASISNNTVFQHYAQSVDLDRKFPNYAFVINHQYQRGLQMTLLCEKCEVSLGIVSWGKLHRYCAREVLKYLSAIDLENLTEAVNR